ncbi:MAG TPA: VPLPA-CTERM sorting domain-containing protein, partial [Acidiferrobacterales bacterium]
QFYIPPNTFEATCVDGGTPCTGGIDYSLVVVETLTDLGGDNYGVVIRWQGRILTADGNPESPFGGFVGSWRLEGVMSTVPVPAAVWLLGSGLLGLVGVAARKKT